MLDKILDFIADKLSTITSQLGVDRVVKQGTMTGWEYKTWANGDIELKTKVNIKFNNESVKETTLILPYTMIDTEYTVLATPTKAGNYAHYFGVFDRNGNMSKTTSSFVFSAYTENPFNYTLGFDIVVLGKWKTGGGTKLGLFARFRRFMNGGANNVR